jgi:hypothetical protein
MIMGVNLLQMISSNYDEREKKKKGEKTGGEKSQIPSTCLRRSGFAQAGQSPNNNQIPSTKIPKP